MRRPLRSILITRTSSLLRVAPPLDRASVLSASCWALVPFPWHRDRRFPQFNIGARSDLTLPLCRTPHGQEAGSRHADPGLTRTPGFDVVSRFSTLERQFTGVRLLGSHLMPGGTFSATLTTRAFDPSRLRWFATCSCKPIARGLLARLAFISHLLRRLLRPTLVHAPARASLPLVPAKDRGQYWQDLDRPAMDSRVIDEDAALFHHLLNMAQAQRIGGVPAHADQHDFDRVVQPLDHLTQCFDHRHHSVVDIAARYPHRLIAAEPLRVPAIPESA